MTGLAAGEVFDGVIVADVVPVALTAAQARTLTDRIRGSLTFAHALITEAFRSAAWSALGYDTWDAYCAGEFADARMVRLDREQRREIVAEMRQAGMSSRAIASGLGVSKNTVTEDVSQIGTPAPSVTGTDGKSYPPAAPRPDATDGPTEALPRRQSLPNQARAAGWELRKATDRLERISADDRFSGHQTQMAAQLRGHLIHTVEVCQDLLDRLSETPGA